MPQKSWQLWRNIANVQCLLVALRHSLKLKQSCHWSVVWSKKLCWLLTTFQSDAASAHWRPSLVSDKHVPACRFQSVSPGAGALVWFLCSQGWKWMMHITVMSCCSNSCCQISVYLSSCWRLLLSSASRVRKSTKLLRHKTLDFTPDVASQQTRPQFCRLRITESHSRMCLSETARDVKHRWWAVVINIMTYYISQRRVETPMIGGQLCCSSITNLGLLQYLCAKL